MPSSNYWNVAHGLTPGEMEQDGEGKQIMALLGKNMAWIMKVIGYGKEQFTPIVNRQVMEAANQSIKELQQFDISGYSGHLSFILYMLSTPAFLDTYIEGKFKPEEIMEFGKSHKIAINKIMG